ncbi:MAG: DUF4266 domain-containing protein [Myxococcales bacterium]|nr:DUF4266 domain-containing protein [Myxococcales bacterium]
MRPTSARPSRPRLVVSLPWFVSLCALASFAAACAPVAPYQRARLADPSMAPGFAESAANEHVQAVQEGAVGGKVGVGSGCGCN